MPNTSIPRLAVWLHASALVLSGCGGSAASDPAPDEPDSDDNAMETTPDEAEPELTAEGLPIVKPPPINVAANDPKTTGPMDATPSPDGKDVYYTALTSEDGEPVAGIFHVPVDGGEIETLHAGLPLVAPVGVTTSFDGERLFVADSAAGESGFGGAILSLPVTGGAPAVLEGTEGYVPQALVIANVGDEEQLYFTGRDPESGEPSAFRTSLDGGSVERLTDAALADPGGIAVRKEGTVFVADSLGGKHLASVLRIADGEAETFVENIGVGFPSGLTLSLDESTLIVSGLDPRARKDRVYFVNVESRELSVMTEPVGAFSESAGLHRAHDANVFAWADSQANGSGTVYVLKP